MKTYFERAGVPWTYDKPHQEVHTQSPYNRQPKGRKHDNNFETRLAMIRKNLSTADDRLEQHRLNRLKNKTPAKSFQVDMAIHKALLAEATAAKFAAKRGTSSKKAAPQDALEGMPTSRKSSPIKGTKGASKGGNVSKKVREHNALLNETMEGSQRAE